jgi:DNA-binding transcriptional MerR regulator
VYKGNLSKIRKLAKSRRVSSKEDRRLASCIRILGRYKGIVLKIIGRQEGGGEDCERRLERIPAVRE